jgi:hypothetical protein
MVPLLDGCRSGLDLGHGPSLEDLSLMKPAGHRASRLELDHRRDRVVQKRPELGNDALDLHRGRGRSGARPSPRPEDSAPRAARLQAGCLWSRSSRPGHLGFGGPPASRRRPPNRRARRAPPDKFSGPGRRSPRIAGRSQRSAPGSWSPQGPFPPSMIGSNTEMLSRTSRRPESGTGWSKNSSIKTSRDPDSRFLTNFTILP